MAKVFALQAGREIRIIVDAQKISDDRAAVIARDIAQKIKDELDYPGQIAVMVIREMRAVNMPDNFIVLFIGDIVGRPGRRALSRALPELKKRIPPFAGHCQWRKCSWRDWSDRRNSSRTSIAG